MDVTIHNEADAQSLVGRTFDGKGGQRTVTRVEDVRRSNGGLYGNVYWKRPGGKERRQPVLLWDFTYVWLRNATEVLDDDEDERCADGWKPCESCGGGHSEAACPDSDA